MKYLTKDDLFFSNAVKSRDNWTCQKCGSTEYVQAHHISPVANYPLFKNLLENGITLCVYCHADIHPEIPRGLFLSKVIQTKKEGKIPAGKLAKELGVQSQTIVSRAKKFGIFKSFQKWMFTEEEADIIKGRLEPPLKRHREIVKFSFDYKEDTIGKIFISLASFGGKKYLNEILEFIMATERLTIHDLVDVIGLERMEIKKIVLALVREQALEKIYTYYYKTPIFIRWLKAHNNFPFNQ